MNRIRSKKIEKKLIGFAILLLSIFIYTISPFVFAGSGGGGGGGGGGTTPSQWAELKGYAWNETIGLISLNCSNDDTCDQVDYKVEVDIKNKAGGSGTGQIKGLAWNPLVGWISFYSTDLSGCPYGSCKAEISWNASNFEGGEFRGWARVLEETSGGVIIIPEDVQRKKDTFFSFDYNIFNRLVKDIFAQGSSPSITEVYLKTSNPEIHGRYGSSVAVSSNHVIVGARDENSYKGRVYIHRRGSDNSWNEVAVFDPTDVAQITSNAGFGASVDNWSGKSFAVGAPNANSTGAIKGAAYIFGGESGGNGGSPDDWGQRNRVLASNGEANDGFGTSVSIDGDLAYTGSVVVVGAPGEDSNGTNPNSNTVLGSGAVYVFQPTSCGVDCLGWNEIALLKASDVASSAAFGTSVKVRGGGNTIIVGAPNVSGPGGDGTSAGAAYIFEKQGNGTWAQTAKLVGSDLYSNGRSVEGFGTSVDLSADGKRAVVGSKLWYKIYVFDKQENGTWVQVAALNSPNAGANFGNDVAIDGEGRRITAADPRWGVGVGGVKIFDRYPGGNWVENIELEELIHSFNQTTQDGFGTKVTMGGSNTLIVGAMDEDGDGNNPPQGEVDRSGAAYFFDLPELEYFPGGWISLSCMNDNSCGTVDYNPVMDDDTGQLSGFAWMGDSLNEYSEPVGWIDFSGATIDLVSTFACFLENKNGRKMVYWSDGQVLGNDSGSDRWFQPPTSVENGVIPNGFYDVTLAVFDGGHPDGETTEKWMLKHAIADPDTGSFITHYIGKSTPDLPDYVKYGEFLVEERVEVPYDIVPLPVNPNAYTKDFFQARYDSETDPAPYGSDIYPVCAALDYTCPFEDEENRTIVHFNNEPTNSPWIQGNLGVNESRTKIYTTDKDGNSLNLAPGQYSISVAAFEENHIGGSGGDQLNEQFVVSFYGNQSATELVATSNETSDLPRTEDYQLAEVNESISFTDQVVAARAEHAYYPGPANSIIPLCAAIDRIGELPNNQCQIPDLPGRIKFQWDGTELLGGLESNPISATDYTIPQGHYKLTIAGYDEHPDGDNDERLDFVFNNSPSTPPYLSFFESTPDFPDDESYYEFDLGVGFIPQAYNLDIYTHEPLRMANIGSGAGSDIHPICAALDPVNPEETCPFAKISGRYIVDFTGGNENIYVANKPITNFTSVSYPIGATSIPPGVYEVKVASYDNGVDGQTNDRWHIVPFEAGSGDELTQTNTTPDYIGNTSAPLIQQIDTLHGPGSEYTLSYAAGTFKARHMDWNNSSPPSPGSVFPLCAAFDLVVPSLGAGESVAIIPAEQGVNLGDIATLDWNIESPPGSLFCTFSSNPTDNIWSSNSGSSPILSGTHQFTVTQNGGHIYRVECAFPSGANGFAEAAINVPPQCSDGIDNDDDGFCDTEGAACDQDNDFGDRGCESPEDNNELGEEICVVNNICETYYGENPLSCPLDCLVGGFEEQ